jgi:hypothetical protein
VRLRAEDVERRSFAFGRADGVVIARLTLGPGGQMHGYRHTNEDSWCIQDGRVAFLNDRGEITTIFREVTREDGFLRMTGEFLLGAEVSHVLAEVTAH